MVKKLTEMRIEFQDAFDKFFIFHKVGFSSSEPNDRKKLLDDYFWWCSKDNILDLINSQEKLNKYKEYQKIKENKNHIKYTKTEILQLLKNKNV